MEIRLFIANKDPAFQWQAFKSKIKYLAWNPQRTPLASQSTTQLRWTMLAVVAQRQGLTDIGTICAIKTFQHKWLLELLNMTSNIIPACTTFSNRCQWPKILTAMEFKAEVASRMSRNLLQWLSTHARPSNGTSNANLSKDWADKTLLIC